jgi:hypothetical protein
MPDILDNLTRTADAPPALNATSDMPVQTTETTDAPAPPATEPAAEPAAEGETPPSVEPQPEAKPRKSARDHIAELTASRRAAEERERRALDANTALAEQMKAVLARLDRPAEPPAPPVETRPTRDTFVAPEEYDAALTEWAARRAVREATQEWERRQAETQRQSEEKRVADAQAQSMEEIVTTWNQRRAAALEKYPDFVEVAEGETPITLPMRDAILSDESGPDVAYWLGMHKTEAERISKLQPVQQIAAIGRIAAQLAAPVPTPPAPPPPINPLRGGTTPPTLSPDEDPGYMERRLSEERSRRTPMGVGRAN